MTPGRNGPFLMTTIQESARNGFLRSFRRVGLAVACRWPWPVSVRLRNGQCMYVDLRSGIGRGIFAKGEFDPAVFAPFRECLKAGDTFLDIGANVGFYSMLALDRVGPGGFVHAFEMEERPLRCLRRTVESTKAENLFVHECAVGKTNGMIGVVAARESGNSFVSASAGRDRVRMIALDSWALQAGVRQIHAIKIDIEGAELPALEGARNILCQFRPLIVCEADESLQARFGYANRDLIRFFADIGYGIRGLESAWSPTLVAEPKP